MKSLKKPAVRETLLAGDVIEHVKSKNIITISRRGVVIVVIKYDITKQMYSFLSAITIATGLNLVQIGKLLGPDNVTFTLTDKEEGTWRTRLYSTDGTITGLTSQDYLSYFDELSLLSFHREADSLLISNNGYNNWDNKIILNLNVTVVAIGIATGLRFPWQDEYGRGKTPKFDSPHFELIHLS